MNRYLEKNNRVKALDTETLGMLFVLFVVAVFFWDTMVLYPIKIFVVILHEFSHGLAAVLTGGKIVKIEIDPAIGGVCWTSGGNRMLVLSAGYLGSILWGSLILLITARTKYDNVLGIIIGSFLILLAALFIRNLFGFFFTAGVGLALVVLCLTAHNKIADFLLKFIGLSSCLYAIIDIKSDLIDRTVDGKGFYGGMKSDAFALAEHIGIPQFSVAIGIAWMVISVVVFFKVLGAASKGETKTESI